MRVLIYLLFFASGVSGLVYEIIWMRRLALTFGCTAHATSAVLSAFMGGLALGSFLFGRLVDRWRNPLRLYGLVEIAIAVSTLVSMLLLLPIMDGGYVWAFRNLSGTGSAIVAVRLGSAVLCLIVPTTLMGGTLPILSRFFVQRSGTLGLEVGNLYGINTIGAAVGCFMTGFVLIRALGETSTVAIALAINLAVGIVTLALAARLKEASVGASVPPESVPAAASANPGPQSRLSGRIRAVLWGFALAGAASLAYEVIWTRMLINVIGSDVYCFTLILTVFLLGIMLGSFIIARFADRIPNPLLVFGLCEVAIGCLALATIPLINALPRISTSIVAPLTEMGLVESSHAQRAFGMFGVAFLVFLGPTLLMGAVFPLVNRIYQEHVHRVGRIVGDVYSVNTLGTIVGAAAAGFLILPAFGIAGSIVAVSFLNLGVGVVLCALERRSRLTVGATVTSAVVAVTCLLLIFGQGLHAGVPGYVKKGRAVSIPYYRETPAGTLSVREQTRDRTVWGYPVRQLVINHHPTAHNLLPDIIVHKMLAHVPLLMHENPERALVVGFGLGSTSYSMLRHAEVQVDCVELLEEEIDTAPYFEAENRNIIHEETERFDLIINDGRNYILATETMYDVISVNAIDPRLSPAIYTWDFFRLCRAKMFDDGVIALWLPTYSISNIAMLSIYKSFQAVFPHSFVLYNNPGHFLLVGSANPIRVDLERFRARAAVPEVRESLGVVGLDDPLVLLSTVILTPDGLEEMLRDVPLNSDANPVVEFDQRRIAGQLNVNPEFFRVVLAHKSDIVPHLVAGSDEEEARAIERYAQQLTAWMRGQLEYHSGSPESGMSRIVSALSLEDNPFLKTSITTRGRRVADDPVLEPHREALIEAFEDVLAARPAMVHIHHFLALGCVGRGDLAGAVAHGEEAARLRPNDWFYRFHLGNWLVQRGHLGEAREHFEQLLETATGRAAGLCGLGIILARQGRFRAAEARLEETLQEDPGFIEARRLLRRIRDRSDPS